MYYKRIKKLCSERDISIRKLEHDLGLGNGVVSKWDGRSSPSVDTLKRIAKYFGVPVLDIVEGGDDD